MFTVGERYVDNPLQAPMTPVFEVNLSHGYDWDEGKLFRHDETGLYAWVTDSGCSCNEYLSWVGDYDPDEPRSAGVDEFVASLAWAPLKHHVEEIIRYIDADADAHSYDRQGPAWRADEKARLQLFLREHRAAGDLP